MTDTNTTPSPIQLSLADLQAIVRVVDVAAERGAFKGPELTAVGTVRDKIANFITSSTASDKTEAETQPTTDAQ